MKTLICNSPGSLKYSEVRKPELEEGNAIVRIRRIGICGTDLHAYKGDQPFFRYPIILGHELSGELVEIDSSSGFKMGEKVTIIPYFSCGNCIACKTGKSNCCCNIKVCGIHQNGGMAEYLSVPLRSLVHGWGLSFEELALVEPLSIAAHGVYRADIKPNEFVLIVGAGPIGLCTTEFVKLVGAIPIVIDVNPQRLRFCKHELKVENVINVKNQNVTQELIKITNGDMPTVVVDASGNIGAINTSFQYMAHGGRYVLIGLQKGIISVNHPEFHKREGTLLSSRNANRSDFDYVISSILDKKINPLLFITHMVSFDQAKDDFPGWTDPKNKVIKAMIKME